MTKKDFKKIEKLVHRILEDMLYEGEPLSLQEGSETMFSMALLEEMENYLGHSIEFMGIS